MFFVWLCVAALGGAWRRWEGAKVTGFLGHRWLKLTCSFFLGLGAAALATRDLYCSLAVAAALTGGWTPGAQFGADDDPNPPWDLLPRYELVSLAVAAIGAALTHDLGKLAYAPVGLLAPLGYWLGKDLRARGTLTCWSCIGEVWLGATLYGGLFLLGVS